MCKLHVYICHHLSSQVNLDVNWMFDSAQRIKCCYLQLGARAKSLTKQIIRPLLRVQNVMRPRRERRALGDSLLALTSQRVLMELVINPLLSVTGSAACLCIRALGSSVLVLLWGGAERWEIYKTDCSHKSCQVKTSCRFRIFFSSSIPLNI